MGVDSLWDILSADSGCHRETDLTDMVGKVNALDEELRVHTTAAALTESMNIAENGGGSESVDCREPEHHEGKP